MKKATLIGLFATLFLTGCAEGENALVNLASNVMNLITFLGVGVAIFMFMFAGMNIIVGRMTNSSRNVSENVKTYVLVGLLLIGLLLVPQITRLVINSFSGLMSESSSTLDRLGTGTQSSK